MTGDISAYALGDTLFLRKSHPCGGYQWRVERLGADIGLRCLTCNHYVLLPRSELKRRLKAVLPANTAGNKTKT